MLRLSTHMQRLSDKTIIAILCGVGLSVNVLVFFLFGIRVVNDTARYFEYRDLLMSNGFFVDQHNIWYVGYVGFLAICKMLGLTNAGTVVVQSVFSIVAGISVFLSTRQLAKTNMAGLTASLLFFGWLKISQWNMYLLCESLYISFTAFTIYFVLIPKRTWKTKAATLLLLFFTFFLKPAGISLMIAVLVFYIATYVTSIRFRILISAFAFLLILLLANRMLSTFLLVETYATGDIIYGCSWAPSQPCPPWFTLDSTGVEIAEAKSPLAKILLFTLNNPWFMLKLMLSKLFAFLIHAKPFYSIYHNLFILCTLIPTYYFLVRGFFKVSSSIKAFVATYFTGSCLVIMLTVEDWDGRFLMPLLPLLFIFACTGFYKQTVNTHHV